MGEFRCGVFLIFTPRILNRIFGLPTHFSIGAFAAADVALSRGSARRLLQFLVAIPQIFLVWSATTLANEMSTVEIPPEFKACVETPLLRGENVRDVEERLVAHPYYGNSLVVSFSLNSDFGPEEADSIQKSCEIFEMISNDLNVVYDVGEFYPMRAGYYGVVELLLLYGEAEIKRNEIGRAYYYFNSASEKLLEGIDACVALPPLNKGWDLFCSTVAAESRLIKVQLFGENLTRQNYPSPAISPEARLAFEEAAKATLNQVRALAVQL